MPEHEAAYDDGDVDYTFTVTDSVSGIPEPEDLPDNDGNSDYMPLVALVSSGQCHTANPRRQDVHRCTTSPATASGARACLKSGQ